MLNDAERSRYDRQLKLTEVGEVGQARLKAARVLVVGAGGLGCPALQYLVAAGVGTVGIVDFDAVQTSNLHRQILFSVSDLGRNKAEAARHHLKEMNPLVNLVIHGVKLDVHNAFEIVEAYEYILDCTDNFASRYLLNDVSVILDKPLVYAAIYKHQGQLSVLNYGGGPTYRCLFPEPPEHAVLDCNATGVLGVLPGTLGLAQATETLKLILEVGTISTGVLRMYDSLKGEWSSIEFERNTVAVNTLRARGRQLPHADYEAYCTTGVAPVQELSAEDLKTLIQQQDIQILDLRTPPVAPAFPGVLTLQISEDQIPSSVEQLDPEATMVVICDHGISSRQVVQYLQDEHHFTNIYNLSKGVSSYVSETT